VKNQPAQTAVTLFHPLIIPRNQPSPFNHPLTTEGDYIYIQLIRILSFLSSPTDNHSLSSAAVIVILNNQGSSSPILRQTNGYPLKSTS
jgi:hypothetical protein